MIGRTEKKEEREGECSPLQGEPVFFKPVRELACQRGEKGGEAELSSTLCAVGFSFELNNLNETLIKS